MTPEIKKIIDGIDEKYFEYPTQDMAPQEVMMRQDIYMLIGIINGLCAK